MLPISKIIEKARIILKDNDGFQNSYKDAELLQYANSAIRFLRMTIRQINPAYLIDYHATFNVTAGVNTYELNLQIACITNVFLDNKRLEEINPFDIENNNEENTPLYFYVTNNKTITLCPTPEKNHVMQVDGISDITEVGMSDYSPFLNEMDDFIVEYIVTRADMGDRFNIAQEQSIMQYIINKIAEAISPKSVQLNVVRSY